MKYLIEISILVSLIVGSLADRGKRLSKDCEIKAEKCYAKCKITMKDTCEELRTTLGGCTSSCPPCVREEIISNFGCSRPDAITYRKILSGSCISNGMQAIISIEECNAAAQAIGNSDITATETKSTYPMPYGCYDLDRVLFLASNPIHRGRGADSISMYSHPICKAGLEGPVPTTLPTTALTTTTLMTPTTTSDSSDVVKQWCCSKVGQYHDFIPGVTWGSFLDEDGQAQWNAKGCHDLVGGSSKSKCPASDSECELTSEGPFNTGCGILETCKPSSNLYEEGNKCVECVKFKTGKWGFCHIFGRGFIEKSHDTYLKRKYCKPDGFIGKDCPWICGLCPGVCRWDSQCDGDQICREIGNDGKQLGICVETTPEKAFCWENPVAPSRKKFGRIDGNKSFKIAISDWCKASCKQDKGNVKIYIKRFLVDIFGLRTKMANDLEYELTKETPFRNIELIVGDCDPAYCDNCKCCNYPSRFKLILSYSK